MKEFTVNELKNLWKVLGYTRRNFTFSKFDYDYIVIKKFARGIQ